MEDLKWGILGGAKIAKEQMVPAIIKEGGSIHALASIRGDEEQLKKDFSFNKLYRSYEALLDDAEVDIVYIALPNHLHFEWAKKALEKGKHVLCEKPVTTSVQEAEILQNSAKFHQRHIFEGFMYQYHPQIAALKELITNKVLGEIQTIKSSFHFVIANPQEDIRMKKEFKGGVLNDLGCYLIHIQSLLLNDFMKDAQLISQEVDGVDVKTCAQIAYNSGVIAQMDCSFSGEFNQSIEIIGEKGMARLPAAFRTDVFAGRGVIELTIEGHQQTVAYEGDAYRLQIAYIQREIQGNSNYETNKLAQQANNLNYLQQKIGGNV